MKIAKIGRTFRAQLAAGKQPHEEDDGEGQEAQHRHRLQDVEGRHDHELGLAALGRQCRDDEREYQRGENGGEHPQRRAQRVFRQMGGIERHRNDIGLGERCAHLVRAVRQQDQAAGDQDEDDEVVEVRQQAMRAKAQR